LTLRLPKPFSMNGVPLIRLDTVLLYDSSLKEVGSSSPPFSYTTSLKNSNVPCEVTVEGKIKVLSSQHENELFRIRFSMLDAKTGVECYSQCAYSPPIRCVSKLQQVFKPKDRKKSKTILKHELHTIPSSTSSSSISNSDVSIRIQAIEQYQRAQFEKIAQGQKTQLEMFEKISSQLKRPRSKISCDEVEDAFGNFVTCLNSLSREERATKLRKICENNQDVVAELSQILPSSSPTPAGGAPSVIKFNEIDIPTFINEWSIPLPLSSSSSSLPPEGNPLATSGSWF